MNVGEESPNVTKHGSNQPAANIATNRRSMLSRQRHSAQSAAEPRTLIVATLLSETSVAGLQLHAAFLKQLSLM